MPKTLLYSDFTRRACWQSSYLCLLTKKCLPSLPVQNVATTAASSLFNWNATQCPPAHAHKAAPSVTVLTEGSVKPMAKPWLYRSPSETKIHRAPVPFGCHFMMLPVPMHSWGYPRLVAIQPHPWRRGGRKGRSLLCLFVHTHEGGEPGGKIQKKEKGRILVFLCSVPRVSKVYKVPCWDSYLERMFR